MHFHLASFIRPVVCLTQLASIAHLPGSSVAASLVISGEIGEIAAMRIETVMISRCRAVIGSFQFMRYLRASSLWRVRFGLSRRQIGHIPLFFSHLSIELIFSPVSLLAGLFSFIFFFTFSFIHLFTYLHIHL
jgi:hypothetical protein